MSLNLSAPETPLPLETKRCPACGKDLLLVMFGVNSHKPDNLAVYCKRCVAAKTQGWRERNVEALNAKREAERRLWAEQEPIRAERKAAQGALKAQIAGMTAGDRILKALSGRLMGWAGLKTVTDLDADTLGDSLARLWDAGRVRIERVGEGRVYSLKKMTTARQPTLPMFGDLWILSKDANPTALAIFHQHYSYRPYADGRKPLHFVGPGSKLVLLTPKADALFVWRKFLSGDGQAGVNCAVFRNESPHRASDLIRDAMRIAWHRWPGERFYTYVNPRKLSTQKCRGREYCPYPPGRCFLESGWRKCGITKARKLLIFECIA